jgi:hypothetical protein
MFSKETDPSAATEVSVHLEKGSYVLELFSVYANAPELREAAIEYMQETPCEVTEWTALEAGLHCEVEEKLPEIVVPDVASADKGGGLFGKTEEKSNSVGHKGINSGDDEFEDMTLKNMVGQLYRRKNAVDPYLESTLPYACVVQPFNRKCFFLVSKFAFKSVNSCRYDEGNFDGPFFSMALVGLLRTS